MGYKRHRQGNVGSSGKWDRQSFRGGWAQHFRQSKSMCKGPEAANILLSPQNCQKKQCGLKGNMVPIKERLKKFARSVFVFPRAQLPQKNPLLLCLAGMWELSWCLQRYNEAKSVYMAVSNLGVFSSPNSTCLCGQKWLFNMSVPLNSCSLKKNFGPAHKLPSSKSEDPSQHRLCRMGTQSVHRPDHQAHSPFSRATREEQGRCVCTRNRAPLKPG